MKPFLALVVLAGFAGLAAGVLGGCGDSSAGPTVDTAVDVDPDAPGPGDDVGVEPPPWQPRYPGHGSFEWLTTSNGVAVATFRHRKAGGGPAVNQVDRLKDHVYSARDAQTPSRELLQRLFFGFRPAGAGADTPWLVGVDADVAYEPGTNVVHAVQRHEGRTIDTWVFAPFHSPRAVERAEHLLVALVRVTGTAGAPADGAAYTLLDLDLGRHAAAREETVIALASGALAETNGADTVVYRPLGAGVRQSAGPRASEGDPEARVANGEPFTGVPVGGVTARSVFVGLEAPLAGGAGEAWAGVVVGFGATGDAEAAAAMVDRFGADRAPAALLQAELDWWEAWHAQETLPSGLHPYEEALYRQSTAVLKMGQVREAGGGHGQILASLVPGQWNISWVRDACYAILGLTRAGHAAEARLALEFMLNARMRPGTAGNFYHERYIEPDLGIELSADYAISVTRYYGDGTEESDSNAAGPNIEWDNWGLFLWALGDYVERTGDESLLDAHWATVSTRVADLLVELIEPETGVLYPDSSIWERHWRPYGQGAEPETRKHYAYSSICAAHGLRVAAALATRRGDDVRAARYAEASDTLRDGLLAHLVVTPVETGLPMLAGNIEELGEEVRYVDQAVVEAINVGLLDGREDVARGTIAAFDRWLRMGSYSPGYFRNDDGTPYDQQEWVMIDLRTASAFVKLGERERGREILDWVTDQARRNFWLLPELYAAGSGDYQANTPMCGFGPGAYILALHALYDAVE